MNFGTASFYKITYLQLLSLIKNRILVEFDFDLMICIKNLTLAIILIILILANPKSIVQYFILCCLTFGETDKENIHYELMEISNYVTRKFISQTRANFWYLHCKGYLLKCASGCTFPP